MSFLPGPGRNRDVEITLDRRYRGPLTSANGGYACGRLAAFVGAEEVEVTLRLPPPLDRPLVVEDEDGRVTLRDGGALVAEARPGRLDLELVAGTGEMPSAVRRMPCTSQG